jgi:hypothetical protein
MTGACRSGELISEQNRSRLQTIRLSGRVLKHRCARNEPADPHHADDRGPQGRRDDEHGDFGGAQTSAIKVGREQAKRGHGEKAADESCSVQQEEDSSHRAAFDVSSREVSPSGLQFRARIVAFIETLS